MTISPTKSQIQQSVDQFIGVILPGLTVVAGVDNQVPEPEVGDFIVMTPIRYERLATNLDTSEDCAFTASISGPNMTVTLVDIGALEVGNQVGGPGVASGTVITAGPSGGGTGTYTVTPSQTVPSAKLSSGATGLMQSVKVTIQLDVHGPSAADNAQTISTTWRDEYGYDTFSAQDFGVTPLYADDPRYVPFVNAESQYEWRWMVEAVLQVNQLVSIPQAYADVAKITAIDVETLE